MLEALYVCSWGGSVCENETTWAAYATFIQYMFNFCIDCTYLSVNRVNDIGENSNFSSQLRADLHCASPIPYHVFLICDIHHPLVQCFCIPLCNIYSNFTSSESLCFQRCFQKVALALLLTSYISVFVGLVIMDFHALFYLLMFNENNILITCWSFT